MMSSLINIKCTIEKMYHEHEWIGLSIDLSHVIEEGISAIDALLEQKISRFDLIDSASGCCITVSVGDAAWNCANNDFFLVFSEGQLCVLRDLMLDVFSKKGFDGYHGDFELVNEGRELDMCFLLQHGVTQYNKD